MEQQEDNQQVRILRCLQYSQKHAPTSSSRRQKLQILLHDELLLGWQAKQPQ